MSQIVRGGDCVVQKKVISYQHNPTSCLAGGGVSAVRGWILTGAIVRKPLLIKTAQVKAQCLIRKYLLTDEDGMKNVEKTGQIKVLQFVSCVYAIR